MTRLKRDVERIVREVLNVYNRASANDLSTTHVAFERALRDIRKQAIDDVATVLADHYLPAIDCNHGKKTDTARCSCSKWTGMPQPSVGAAVRQWVFHVVAIARARENQEAGA